MLLKRHIIPILLIFLVFASGCGVVAAGEMATPQSAAVAQDAAATMIPSAIAPDPPAAGVPATDDPVSTQPSINATPTTAPTPTATEVAFEVGREITIEYLQDLEITGSEIIFEEQLTPGANYHQHLVSYVSEGNRIYGLLTIPFEEAPEGGFKAIVFNHGYIPPTVYRTTERYSAYVDYLARSGFMVFKIDLRGHGQSQGEPTGSYFSPGYTIDAITALKSLQKLEIIDPQGIGMWGHSMAGNLVLRAMLVEPDVQAGVIWAGAVYSYDDFAKYGIDDDTYRPPETVQTQEASGSRRRSREIFDTYGQPDLEVDYWRAVSLTENIALLESPLQLHHAENDPVVTIGYSSDLAAVLQESGKRYEFYSYEGGGHNLNSPYFGQAMQRTVEFFRSNL